jgi:hypothetical protein
LIFLVLIVIVVCPFPEYDREERRRKKNEFRKEIADCILESSKISSELRKQIEDNKDDDLRKVLHLHITRLDETDREVIRKCRREYFGKIRNIHRERLHERFNRNFTHHHYNDDEHEGPFHKKRI